MSISKVLTLLACAAYVQAQTPVDRSWTILLTAAEDKKAETRGKAVHALGAIRGNPRAQTAAETALKDADEDVRAAGAIALGAMGATGSIPKLKEAIKDEATTVVFAATNALFVMGDPAAYEVYYAVLTGQRKSGDALIESQMKMLKDPKALTKLGVEAGIGFIPFGGVSYKAYKMVKADNVSPVRAAAATKLINDPDPKAAEALTEATKDDKWLVRAAAVNAIAKRNDRALLPALLPLLDDKEDIVRFNAAGAVIQLSK